MYAVVIRLNGIYRHNFDVYYALYRLHAMRIAPCPYVYTYILRFRWFRFRWTRVVLGFSSFESTLFSASDQNRFPPLRLLDVSFRTKPSKSPTTRRRRRFSISIRNQKSVTGDPPPTGAPRTKRGCGSSPGTRHVAKRAARRLLRITSEGSKPV